MNLVLLKF